PARRAPGGGDRSRALPRGGGARRRSPLRAGRAGGGGGVAAVCAHARRGVARGRGSRPRVGFGEPAVRKTVGIARRELASMFGGPLAWVLVAVFAMLTGYFFYSDLTFYVLFGGANLSSGLWRYMFLDFRMVAMLVVPLVTMRLLAEERKLGTLELL